MEQENFDYGFTNHSYKKDDKFVQEKIKNEFNHNFSYTILNNFSFVPRLISDTPTTVIWEYLKPEPLIWNQKTLTEIAHMLRKLHLSNIKLPKNNYSQRIKKYLTIINDKKLYIPEIHNNFKKMNKILANMNRVNPLHNDCWPHNIIQSQGQLWLVDWEYATMGDRHFDLAYFIQSANLNAQQKAIFLDAYDTYEIRDYPAYRPELLPHYDKLVAYLTLLWLYAQEKLIFDPAPLKAIMNK